MTAVVQLSPRSSYSHISITVLSYLRNHEFCLSRIAILGLGPVCDLDGSTCRPPTSENDVPEEEDDGVSFRQLHVSCAILSQLYADGLHLRSIHGHQTIIQNCPVGIFNLRDHSVSQAMARAVAAHWHLNHLTMHRIVIDNAVWSENLQAGLKTDMPGSAFQSNSPARGPATARKRTGS